MQIKLSSYCSILKVVQRSVALPSFIFVFMNLVQSIILEAVQSTEQVVDFAQSMLVSEPPLTGLD